MGLVAECERISLGSSLFGWGTGPSGRNVSVFTLFTNSCHRISIEANSINGKGRFGKGNLRRSSVLRIFLSPRFDRHFGLLVGVEPKG